MIAVATDSIVGPAILTSTTSPASVVARCRTVALTCATITMVTGEMKAVR
jgi:hypothetical protein